MGRALRVELLAPKSVFTPTQVDLLGEDTVITHHPQYDRIAFWIRSLAQNDARQLREVWRGCRTDSKDTRLQYA
jgi:hypothetical protein